MNIIDINKTESQKSHVVEKGETLWDIARRNLSEKEPDSTPDSHDTKAEVKRLAEINGIKNPSVIKPGQTIFFGNWID